MSVEMMIEDRPLKELVQEAASDDLLRQVLDQVSDLSLEQFGDDVVEEYSAPGKNGRLTAIYQLAEEADDASVSSWGSDVQLLGFMVNKFIQPKVGGQCLNIVYVAVNEAFRGKGTGKRLVKGALALGRARKDVNQVTLSALPTAIDFYKRIGFKGFEGVLSQQEGAAAGQLYMEYRCVGNKTKRSRK